VKKLEQIVTIPEKRMGFVVGKEGNVKKDIEKYGNVKIKAENSSLTLIGESLNIMKASEVIKAIGIGFAKEQAFELFQEKNQLFTFDIGKLIPETQSERVIGRIIGESGKVKVYLEEKLELKIFISNEIAAAIGDAMRAQVFREVLEKLMKGATHASVYKHIDRRLAQLENL
jgi:ribosomal RNA assembly protein